MFAPKEHWAWYFSQRDDRLLLDVGDGLVFETNLPAKLLTQCVGTRTNFTVDDASSFERFYHSLSVLPLSEDDKMTLVLNCIAAKRFHKPVLPKSWFFSVAPVFMLPKFGQLISLSNEFNQGHFIVLEVGENACFVINAEYDSFQLSENKNLAFGEAIKVMHNRVSFPFYRTSVERTYYAS